MADINEIKERVLSTIGSVADKTKEVAVLAADKAKGLARIAKLSVEINAERDRIKKTYAEIGKLYYETHKDDPDGFFVQLCDEIGTANDCILAKEAEIAELKASVPDLDDSDFDIEDFTIEEEHCECGCCEEHMAEAVEAADEAVTEEASEEEEPAE